jgi:hypothetical protein
MGSFVVFALGYAAGAAAMLLLIALVILNRRLRVRSQSDRSADQQEDLAPGRPRRSRSLHSGAEYPPAWGRRTDHSRASLGKTRYTKNQEH